MSLNTIPTLLYVLPALAALCFYLRRPLPRWWQAQTPPDDTTWHDVVDALTRDPILIDKPDQGHFHWLTPAFIIAALVAWLYWLFGSLHLKLYALLTGPGGGNYTLLLGALLVCLTFALTVRSKQQADNRQIWIDTMRDELSVFMSHLQELYAHGESLQQNRREMERARMHIELLINPADRLHRTLGLLLRVASGLRPINAIDGPVLKRLKTLDLPAATPISALRWNGKSRPEHDQLLVAQVYIQRLANVVLKQEWQRVNGNH